MQVEAFVGGRPLIPDQRRELTGFVICFGGVESQFPRRAIGFGSGQRSERRGKAVTRYGLDDLDGCRDGFLTARLDHVVPATAGRVSEHRRLTSIEPGEEAHVVGMVGDHQEVERPTEFHAQSG
jgi:hypothetical protein